MNADLSDIPTDFTVSLTLFGDEDQAEIESRVMDRISNEVGWAILDCDITPVN